MKNKDNRSYKNVKYWPTQKLKEVLDDKPYYRTNTGHDYTDLKDEIEEVYFQRMNRLAEIQIEKQIQQREF